MNVLKSFFTGIHTTSNNDETNEVHEIVKRIFGEELLLRDSSEDKNQRERYVRHISSAYPRLLDGRARLKGSCMRPSRQLTIPQPATEGTDEAHSDDRAGRLGPRLVVFDAITGSGRVVLVGDERVAMQGLSNFATLRATACVYAGRWMYEMMLGSKGIMQIGWCTAQCSFSSDAGVGDTQHSYAYDGGRVRKWNVATREYGEAWVAGDVIGSYIDLDTGTIGFFRNGRDLGIAFRNVARGPGLAYFPAVSLALQESVYGNFGHVPFVYPINGYEPLQSSPLRDCERAAGLLAAVDALIHEMRSRESLNVTNNKPDRRQTRGIKKSNDGLESNENVKYTTAEKGKPKVNIVAATPEDKMSDKAFLLSLARIVFGELSPLLHNSYTVVGVLLPWLRTMAGVSSGTVVVSAPALPTKEYKEARDSYDRYKGSGFINLCQKMRQNRNEQLQLFLELMWGLVDEVAIGEALEHAVVREALLHELVSQDLTFNRQLESEYLLCSLMQHVPTRQYLVKNVLFGKISFDNFLHVKQPEDETLGKILRGIWWEKPTPVHGECDPKIAEAASKATLHLDDTFNKVVGHSNSEKLICPFKKKDTPKPRLSKIQTEKQYIEDCEKISQSIEPIEQLQVEFLKLMLDNEDGSLVRPSTRKIFLGKLRRFIMDTCILDMRLFNIGRTSSSIALCAFYRLQSAFFQLWDAEAPKVVPVAMPAKCFYDGSFDFYNVDRLGGVLPFLVRTLKKELVEVLGEDHPFIVSFEPKVNRNGGIDAGVSDATSVIGPQMATLPQVISSIARLMQANVSVTTPPSSSGYRSSDLGADADIPSRSEV